MDAHRFNHLVSRFCKAAGFYASGVPQEKKDAFRPEMQMVMGEMETLYHKLKPIKTPEASYECAMLLFDGREGV